jgi:hypothetical protein
MDQFRNEVVRTEVRSGSKADPKPRILKVRSSINSGHSPKRPSGLFFSKKMKILRRNQDHRSASSSRQRIDHPHPEGLTTRLVPVEVDLKQQIFDVCSSLNNGHSPKGRLRQHCADFVAKVENRTTLKISRELIFGPLCCCVDFQRHYGGP